jgi:CRP/FNR family transcriptional regulator, cyclic AMP receptor protein
LPGHPHGAWVGADALARKNKDSVVLKRKMSDLKKKFLSRLSAAALHDLRLLARPALYPSGYLLFREREILTSVFIPIEGEILLTIASREGRRVVAAVVGSEEILGLTSLFAGGPAETAAEIFYDSRIMAISHEKFTRFLEWHPEVYPILMESLSRHLVPIFDHLKSVGLSFTAQGRLIRLLLEWCRAGQVTKEGTVFSAPLTQQEIGERIGTARETVSRILGKLKKLKLVTRCGRMLVVPDLQALTEYDELHRRAAPLEMRLRRS